MIAVDFPESNKIYIGDDMFDLPAHDDGTYLTTCWQLNKEDIERIAKTGKFYLRIMARRQPPIMLDTVSPFAVPGPMNVPEDILDKVCLTYINDVEMVILEVPEEYYSFKIKHQSLQGVDIWRLLVKHKKFNDQEFETTFYFYEDVTVLGLVSEQYGEYDFISESLLKKDPKTLLLLKRTNTTV